VPVYGVIILTLKLYLFGDRKL